MMMKALIRKQFGEYFSSYYVDRKTGKPCSKGKVTAKFIGFAVLCLFLCVMFSLQAMGIGQMLRSDPGAQSDITLTPQMISQVTGMTEEEAAALPPETIAAMETEIAAQTASSMPTDFDPGRLYFTLLGILAILMGTFGSVFNTYAGMYLAKDNDLLLSMPIPPRRILAARLVSVYGLALLYSGMVWLPACVIYWILSPAVTAAAVILEMLLLFIIPLFVSVFTCALGWVVALVSTRLKNKSIVTVIVSLACFGLYYYVCFQFSDLMESLISNGAAVDSALNTWVKFLCWIGEAGTGKVLSMLLFTGITAAAALIAFLILSRSFYRIALRSAPAGNSAKKVQKAAMAKQAGARSTRMALYMREMKRFTSSPTYMLNCGLGLVMMPVICAVLMIKSSSVTPLLDTLGEISPLLSNIVCPAALLITGFLGGMSTISTPSISLEGKSLWILRSLPVTGKQVLQSKLMLHISISTLPTCVSVLMLGIGLSCSALQCILLMICSFLFCAYTGLLGLIIGVKRPDFNWTNETYPIKQSSNVLLTLLAGWAAGLLVPGLCWAGGLIMDQTLSLTLTTLLMAGLCFILLKVMNTKSAQRFEKL